MFSYFLYFQEEFRRLYTQLELLKEKNMRHGNRHLAAKITAMQDAAARLDKHDAAQNNATNVTETSRAAQAKQLNSIKNVAASADRLVCAALVSGPAPHFAHINTLTLGGSHRVNLFRNDFNNSSN